MQRFVYFKAVNVVYLILDPPNVVWLLLQEKLDPLVFARIELKVSDVFKVLLKCCR